MLLNMSLALILLSIISVEQVKGQADTCVANDHSVNVTAFPYFSNKSGALHPCQYAGWLSYTNDKTQKSYNNFYWYFKNVKNGNNMDAPLVIYFQEGIKKAS